VPTSRQEQAQHEGTVAMNSHRYILLSFLLAGCGGGQIPDTPQDVSIVEIGAVESTASVTSEPLPTATQPEFIAEAQITLTEHSESNSSLSEAHTDVGETSEVTEILEVTENENITPPEPTIETRYSVFISHEVIHQRGDVSDGVSKGDFVAEKRTIKRWPGAQEGVLADYPDDYCMAYSANGVVTFPALPSRWDIVETGILRTSESIDVGPSVYFETNNTPYMRIDRRGGAGNGYTHPTYTYSKEPLRQIGVGFIDNDYPPPMTELTVRFDAAEFLALDDITIPAINEVILEYPLPNSAYSLGETLLWEAPDNPDNYQLAFLGLWKENNRTYSFTCFVEDDGEFTLPIELADTIGENIVFTDISVSRIFRKTITLDDTDIRIYSVLSSVRLFL